MFDYLKRKIVDETLDEFQEMKNWTQEKKDSLTGIVQKASKGLRENKILKPLLGEDKKVDSFMKNYFEHLDVHVLQTFIRKITDRYCNSVAVGTMVDLISGLAIEYDLRDLGTVAAIRNADTLITGGTRSGKTLYAQGILGALYGDQHYTEKTVTPSLDTKEFTDRDMKKLTLGGLLSDSLKGKPILKKHAILLNEPNRAIPELQNIFINLLDYDFEDEGKKFDVGIKTKNDRPYQLRIFTINEGDEYTGVSTIDQAVTERMLMTIPIDNYPQTMKDKIRQTKLSKVTKDDFRNSKSHIEKILDLHHFSSSLELDELATNYIHYLGNLDNCTKTPDNRKSGYTNIKQFCNDGCHHNVEYEEICGSVKSISNGTLSNLVDVSKGFAVMRSYKVAQKHQEKKLNPKDLKQYTKNLKVTLQDVTMASPFVLYKKIPINRTWINQKFGGKEWNAVQYITDTTAQKFVAMYDQNRELYNSVNSGNPSSSEIKDISQILKDDDPWAFSNEFLK